MVDVMTRVSARIEATSRPTCPSDSPSATITRANSPAWASASEQSVPTREPYPNRYSAGPIVMNRLITTNADSASATPTTWIESI